METSRTKFLYAGIAYDTYVKDSHKLKKEGLPVHKLGREFPYLWGEGRGTPGKLEIYYVLLPEHKGRSKISGKFKPWKPERAWQLLEKAWDKTAGTLNCREQILAYELNKNLSQVPEELMAACLYRQRPFDRLCISLPADGGEYDARRTIELINPYLARIRQVDFAGEESEASEILEDYLYGEFGIVMTKSAIRPSGVPWLDLREDAEGFSSVQRGLREEVGGFSGVQKDLREIRHINRLAALKFLDTAVKNGYNTEVN